MRNPLVVLESWIQWAANFLCDFPCFFFCSLCHPLLLLLLGKNSLHLHVINIDFGRTASFHHFKWCTSNLIEYQIYTKIDRIIGYRSLWQQTIRCDGTYLPFRYVMVAMVMVLLHLIYRGKSQYKIYWNERIINKRKNPSKANDRLSLSYKSVHKYRIPF